MASFIFISHWRAIANDAKRRKRHHLASICKREPYQIFFLSLQNESVVVWDMQGSHTLQRFGSTGCIFGGFVKGKKSVPNNQTVWVLDY